MQKSFKFAFVGSLLALAQFASAEAMPMHQNIQLHPAWGSHTSAPAQRQAVNGQAQIQRLHQEAGPGSMAG
ncbi:hypothetical protein JHS3_21400 [Jeongeupia sp. HS-3]|uniref:hypothetical protein n=1 Tax=Jeongeupia sp. HS-3 TaxID=1009682 RepID=UPI0018A67E27|nr:hypothetical protein [Jeongeupia sp. HS-3]BCL76404.1 hypothetical protein JHS3_21400 [Jeongeupia sp. HS-3]